MLKSDRGGAVTAGTTAQSVQVHGLACLIQNNSESAKVYFKEKSEDGVAATASNGFAVGPGKTLEVPLVAREVSIVSDTASTAVRVLILDMG